MYLYVLFIYLDRQIDRNIDQLIDRLIDSVAFCILGVASVRQGGGRLLHGQRHGRRVCSILAFYRSDMMAVFIVAYSYFTFQYKK